MVSPTDIIYGITPHVAWILGALQGSHYGLVSAQALQAYEWFLNLEDEIRLVHPSPWTTVKVAYLLCRYYPLLYWPIMQWAFLSRRPLETCNAVLKPVHAFFMPMTLPAQAVLCMRAYAFSGRNRLVLVSFIILYTCLVATHIWVFWVDVPILAYEHVHPGLAGLGCFPDYSIWGLGRRIWPDIVIGVVMSFWSLAVVIYFCIQRSSRQTSLGRYFLKQGLTSFAYTLLTNAVCLILYIKGQGLSAAGLPFVYLLPDVLACRLILQLRGRNHMTETQISRMQSRLVRHAFQTSHEYRRSGETSNNYTDIWAIRHEEDSR